MTELITRLRSWLDELRRDGMHYRADILAVTIESLTRLETTAASTSAAAVQSAALALSEYGWSQLTVEQGIQAEDYPDELPGAVADWLMNYAQDERPAPQTQLVIDDRVLCEPPPGDASVLHAVAWDGAGRAQHVEVGQPILHCPPVPMDMMRALAAEASKELLANWERSVEDGTTDV